jgi:hypothetical protein
MGLLSIPSRNNSQIEVHQKILTTLSCVRNNCGPIKTSLSVFPHRAHPGTEPPTNLLTFVEIASGSLWIYEQQLENDPIKVIDPALAEASSDLPDNFGIPARTPLPPNVWL